MPGLGMTKAGGYGAAAGGVLPGVSMLHGIAFSLIARQGGKSLTNPVNLRAFNQILKATDEDIARIYKPWTYGKYGTAPKSLALKNALATIGYNFADDLEELELSIADVENQQRRKNALANIRSEVDVMTGQGEKGLGEQQDDNIQKINLQRKLNEIREESLAPTVTGAATAVPSSPTPVATAGGNNFGGGATGSSIANSNLANSAVTIGSTAVSLGATAASLAGVTSITSAAVVTDDDGFRVRDNSDSSKQLAFQCSGITTSTTRTMTIPDADGTIATQAYVNSQISAEDLDITTDSGTIDIDLNSEVLTIAGGTNIATSASGTTVTVAVDGSFATEGFATAIAVALG